jgi:DNA invertase Pin-like site-specific DNA recombinase
MTAKSYFSYVRVSTQRQGQLGTSLAEQNAAIERYAQRSDLKIIKKYEERETAAQQGRPVFLEMLKELRRGKACGVIIHKIDRSARNLVDWAKLNSLFDAGIEVHFAAESLDLNSRGGRLSADIQAVVAADYIRNLREEVKKGFYGRLKQGLYPMPAPIGYVDAGQGQPKKPHPVYAPLLKKAFELYATGKYGMVYLLEKMTRLGLRNKNGKPISKNTFNRVLKNEFYTGIIKIEKTGEIFRGCHQPIISRKLYEEVKRVMNGKTIGKQKTHFFVFRRLISCAFCSRSLIPERQKGWVYYRCQTRNCPQKTVREELIEENFCRILEDLRFNEREQRYLAHLIRRRRGEMQSHGEKRKQALELQIEQCRERLSKLTDALIDGTLDKELFINKKNALVLEQEKLKDELTNFEQNISASFEEAEKILELANSAYSSYKKATGEEKREMVKIVTSNLSINGKSLAIKLNLPFDLILNRSKNSDGGAHRDTPRTLASMVEKIAECFFNAKLK